jgi:hypothetical protein
MVLKNDTHNLYKSEYHIDQLLENERRTCTFCIGKSSLYIFTVFKQYFINSLEFFKFDLFCHLYDAYCIVKVEVSGI